MESEFRHSAMKHRRRLRAAVCVTLGLALVPALFETAAAQKSLFVALNNSKGYVVGAKLQESGIFRYAGDTSWTHVGWNHPFISGMAFADQASGTIHASAGNGEMTSFDGGETWRITTGWEVTEAQHIALDKVDRDRVYLATSYGIWLSTDDGATWEQTHDDYTQAIVADVMTERRALAATEHGLMVSDTGGSSWNLVGPAVPMIDVDQSDSHPLEWVAGSRYDGILRSSDGGVTWTNSLDTDSSATAVAIDPANHLRMAAATWGAGLFVSDDGGTSWTNRTRGLPLPHIVEVAFDGNGTGKLWAATREEGIFSSDDFGSTWQYAGMSGTMVFDMVFAQ